MSTIPTGRITSVYFETAAGLFIKIADHIDNEKLLKLSFKAQGQENIGTWNVFVKRHPNSMLLRAFETDYDSAVKLINWIENYDFNKSIESQTITMKLVGSEDFGDVIKMYYTIISMHILREYRGQDLRNDILQYLDAAPLSANEFIMIHEYCFVDAGMLKRMVDNFLWARIDGSNPAYSIDQAEQIEAFCEQAGIWENMMTRREHLLAKKATEEADGAAKRRWIMMQNAAESEKEKDMWQKMAFNADEMADLAPPFNPPYRSPNFRDRRGSRGRGG